MIDKNLEIVMINITKFCKKCTIEIIKYKSINVSNLNYRQLTPKWKNLTPNISLVSLITLIVLEEENISLPSYVTLKILWTVSSTSGNSILERYLFLT